MLQDEQASAPQHYPAFADPSASVTLERFRLSDQLSTRAQSTPLWQRTKGLLCELCLAVFRLDLVKKELLTEKSWNPSCTPDSPGKQQRRRKATESHCAAARCSYPRTHALDDWASMLGVQSAWCTLPQP